MNNEITITPEQYHKGLDLLWGALSQCGNTKSGSVFELVHNQLLKQNEEIDILLPVAEFYGDEVNYMMDGNKSNCLLHKGEPLKDILDLNDCNPFGGKRARTALQELKELEK